MKEKKSKKMKRRLLWMLAAIAVGGGLNPFVAEAATELTDQTYTSWMDQISVGNYTVTSGDVTLDASGYTGLLSNQQALINTRSGAVNIDIAEGKTLTVKGFNNYEGHKRSALYASKVGLSGVMTFTGGNIVVSNEIPNSSTNVFGLFAEAEGKFDFKSAVDNKVNLTILMPQIDSSVSTHRFGVGLDRGELAFDGERFVIQVDSNPGVGSTDRRVGLLMANDSILNIKADAIWIDANELAFQMTKSLFSNGSPGTVGNQALFEANSITLQASEGILSVADSTGPKNQIKFSGKTQINAIAVDGVGNIYNEMTAGRAIDIEGTELIFKSETSIEGKNETPAATGAGLQHWLKTITINKGSTMIAEEKFTLSSTGGFYNTALHVRNQSLASFEKETQIDVKNGTETARAVYIFDDDVDGTTKAKFKEDLIISFDSQADYLSGLETQAGGKIEVDKGLVMTEQAKSLTWSVYAKGGDSKISVNSSGLGTVQVIGDVGGINGGAASIHLNNDQSYLHGATFTSTSVSISNGTVKLQVANEALWKATGTSTVTELTLDQGKVEFGMTEGTGNIKYDTVTVGTLSGEGSFSMRTNIAGNGYGTYQKGDKLIITDTNSTGNYQLSITDHGSAPTNGTERLIVVRAASQGAVFSLDHVVDAGGYQYNLGRTAANPAHWELYSNGTAAPTAHAVHLFSGAYLLNYAEVQTLSKRLGDLRRGGGKKGAWGRVYGGKFSSAGDGFLHGFDMDYWGVQAGYDQKLNRKDPKSNVYVGGFFGYTKGQMSYLESGSGSIDSKSLGIYGTYIRDNGFYVDTMMKYNWMKNDFKNLDSGGMAVKGDDIHTEGFAASVEVGKRYFFDKADEKGAKVKPADRQGWYVEPQLQFLMGHQSGGRFTASNGLHVQADSFQSLMGKAEIRLGFEVKKGKNPINLYGKFGVVKEFDGNVNYSLNGSPEKTSYKDTWRVWGVGATAQIGKKHNLYLEVERATGGQFTQDWAVNGGYRFHW